jgi:maltose alpha-D-glucosyltransferase/alpha-amylase
MRIRCHGDFHLGQVLVTTDDFVIIDFDGEPSRSLAERRRKSCPLRDIAGMLRSIDYAILTALRSGRFRLDELARLERWAASLRDRASTTFVQRYTEYSLDMALIPPDHAARLTLLRFYEFEKCLYEVGYELHNRPDWVEIPLLGLARLVGLDDRSDVVSP